MLPDRPCTRWHTGSTDGSKVSVAPWRRGKFYALCSSKSLTPSLRTSFVGWAIALLCVFSNWYTTVLVDMLHDEKEPSEWKHLHVGAESGVNCEHMQALVTNMFQPHWELQEDRRVGLKPERLRYNTAFMSNLDFKTAFDVARPTVVSKILTLRGVHGHLIAAVLAEMQDVRGSASFENCETQFRYSRCIRQGGVDASVLWRRIAKYVLWKAEEKWRAKGWGLPSGGQHDNGYTLRGMMWADNYWLFSDHSKKLICTVNDIIEGLLDLDVEPKPGSLWWTSTRKDDDMRTLRVGGRDKVWDLSFL